MSPNTSTAAVAALVIEDIRNRFYPICPIASDPARNSLLQLGSQREPIAAWPERFEERVASAGDGRGLAGTPDCRERGSGHGGLAPRARCIRTGFLDPDGR